MSLPCRAVVRAPSHTPSSASTRPAALLRHRPSSAINARAAPISSRQLVQEGALGFLRAWRPHPHLCRAGGGGGPEPAATSGWQPAAAQLVASPFYRVWLQLGVVLLVLMLIDAAYSGDWSRIGVLTKEQEGQLQQVAVALGCFHLACGAGAAAVSSQRGERWQPRAAKALAVGFLALVEVLLLPEEKPGQGA